MEKLNQKMVAKGSQDSTRAVVEQGEVTMSNAIAHESALLKAGLPVSWRTELELWLGKVRAARGTQIEVKEETKSAAVSEATLRSNAKIFARRAKNGGRLVLLDGPVEGLVGDSFDLGPTGRSSAEVIDTLDRLRPKVALADDRLKPYFEGKSALGELDQHRSALSRACGDQKSKRQNAPLETQVLYEAQGQVISLVERINLVARIAFDGQADILALFNKDVLLRYRRGKKGAKRSEVDQPAQTAVTVPV